MAMADAKEGSPRDTAIEQLRGELAVSLGRLPVRVRRPDSSDDPGAVAGFLWDGPGEAWRTSGTVGVREGRLVIEHIRIDPRFRSRRTHAGVTADLLRAIPIGRLLNSISHELDMHRFVDD